MRNFGEAVTDVKGPVLASISLEHLWWNIGKSTGKNHRLL